MNFSRAEVHTYYTSRVPGLKQSGKELRGACPVHVGQGPNFSVNLETGFAHCHSQCNRGWDIISLEMELAGVGFPQAKERVYDLLGRPRIPSVITSKPAISYHFKTGQSNHPQDQMMLPCRPTCRQVAS